MNLLIGVCIAVLTVAILFLLYAAFKTLKLAEKAIAEAKQTIGELREETKLTIGELRGEVLHVSQDMRAVVQNTKAVTLDAREKMKELDDLFGTAREIGQAAHVLASAVKQTAAGAISKMRQSGHAAESAIVASEKEGRKVDHGTVAAIADGIASSIRIWSRMKHR